MRELYMYSLLQSRWVEDTRLLMLSLISHSHCSPFSDNQTSNHSYRSQVHPFSPTSYPSTRLYTLSSKVAVQSALTLSLNTEKQCLTRLDFISLIKEEARHSIFCSLSLMMFMAHLTRMNSLSLRERNLWCVRIHALSSLNRNTLIEI